MANKNKMKEMVAARNPLTRRAITPVDLYSQPTEPEQVKEPEAKETAAAKPKRQPAPQIDPGAARASATVPSNSERETTHYSTYLYKDQVKTIKVRAAMSDRKDQEIVQEALDEYFKKHSL